MMMMDMIVSDTYGASKDIHICIICFLAPNDPRADDSVFKVQDISFFPLSKSAEKIKKIAISRRTGEDVHEHMDNASPYFLSLVMSRGVDGGALSSINNLSSKFRSVAQVTRNMPLKVNVCREDRQAKPNMINVQHELWTKWLTDGSRHFLHLEIDPTNGYLRIVLVRRSHNQCFYTVNGSDWLVFDWDRVIFDFCPIGLMVGYTANYIILENSPSILANS